VLNTSVWLSYILSSIFYDNPTMVKGIVQYIMDDIKNVPDVKYFFLFSALWLCSTPVCIELLEKMKTNLNIDEEEKSAISLALQNVLKSPFFLESFPLIPDLLISPHIGLLILHSLYKLRKDPNYFYLIMLLTAGDIKLDLDDVSEEDKKILKQNYFNIGIELLNDEILRDNSRKLVEEFAIHFFNPERENIFLKFLNDFYASNPLMLVSNLNLYTIDKNLGLSLLFNKISYLWSIGYIYPPNLTNDVDKK